MNNRVMHFEVQADNVARAKKFYEKALGWKIKQWMSEEKGGMDYWGIITGKGKGPGINGGLYKRPKKKSEKFRLYDCTVTVKNIDRVIKAVKKNGGKITRKKTLMKGIGYFASAKDTEGNRFGLMQPTDWKPK